MQTEAAKALRRNAPIVVTTFLEHSAPLRYLPFVVVDALGPAPAVRACFVLCDWSCKTLFAPPSIGVVAPRLLLFSVATLALARRFWPERPTTRDPSPPVVQEIPDWCVVL